MPVASSTSAPAGASRRSPTRAIRPSWISTSRGPQLGPEQLPALHQQVVPHVLGHPQSVAQPLRRRHVAAGRRGRGRQPGARTARWTRPARPCGSTTLSSKPTRTLPPSASAAKVSGSWARPIPIACHIVPCGSMAMSWGSRAGSPGMPPRTPITKLNCSGSLTRPRRDEVQAEADVAEVVDLELRAGCPRSCITFASRSTKSGGLGKVPVPNVIEAGFSVAIGARRRHRSR